MLAQTVQIITERGVFTHSEPLAVGWIGVGALVLTLVGLWIYLELRNAPELPNKVARKHGCRIGKFNDDANL